MPVIGQPLETTGTAASVVRMDHAEHHDHAAMGHSGDTLAQFGMPGMDHSMPSDHGGHSGHSGHSSSSMCSMSMVWNNDPTNLCLVFPSWRITGYDSSLYASLMLVVGLGVLYEWLRLQLKRLDKRLVRPSPKSAGSRMRFSATPHRRVASATMSPGRPMQGDDGNNVFISSLSSGTEAEGSAASSRRIPTSPLASNEDAGPLLGRRNAAYDAKQKTSNGRPDESRMSHAFRIPPLRLPRSSQLLRSAGYAASVSLSFFLMLLFMTYNSWIIGAVVAGAALGHYLFQRPGAGDNDHTDEESEGDNGEDSRGMACH